MFQKRWMQSGVILVLQILPLTSMLVYKLSTTNRLDLIPLYMEHHKGMKQKLGFALEIVSSDLIAFKPCCPQLFGFSVLLGQYNRFYCVHTEMLWGSAHACIRNVAVPVSWLSAWQLLAFLLPFVPSATHAQVTSYICYTSSNGTCAQIFWPLGNC